MHAPNSYYGHKAILARYVGLGGRPPPIWGFLQHGWDLYHGFGALNAPLFRHYPKLVWNRWNLKHAVAADFGPVFAIGAPFLYLPTRLVVPPKQNRVLVYPFHSSNWEVDLVGSWESLAKSLTGRFPAERTTVCLFLRDFKDARIRSEFLSRGMKTIHHGSRDNATFLQAQVQAIQDHSHVVSNRVSTALWYAASLGRRVEILSPVFGIGSKEEGEAFDRIQRARWPQLFSEGVDGAEAIELGRRELGAEFLREPAELIDFFGWKPLHRTAGYALEPMVRLARRVWHIGQKRIPTEERLRGS